MTTILGKKNIDRLQNKAGHDSATASITLFNSTDDQYKICSKQLFERTTVPTVISKVVGGTTAKALAGHQSVVGEKRFSFATLVFLVLFLFLCYFPFITVLLLLLFQFFNCSYLRSFLT